MECKDAMDPTSLFLYVDQPAGHAIEFMIQHRTELVAVVDRDQCLVGLINSDQLMARMIPQSLKILREMPRASYLQESPEELTERLDQLAQLPLSDLLETDIEVVKPDALVIDAINKLSTKDKLIPVVDEQNKLLGTISFFSIAKALKGWAAENGNDKPFCGTEQCGDAADNQGEDQ